jgi:excisionase family DNA binding protein
VAVSGHSPGHSVPQIAGSTAVPRRPQDTASRASRLCSLTEAASYLGVSRDTLRRMVWRGELRPVRLPGVRRMLFGRDDLSRLVEDWKCA